MSTQKDQGRPWAGRWVSGRVGLLAGASALLLAASLALFAREAFVGSSADGTSRGHAREMKDADSASSPGANPGRRSEVETPLSFGEPVEVRGLSVQVNGASVESPAPGVQQIVVGVTLTNTGSRPQVISPDAFTLERGRIGRPPAPETLEDALLPGTLEPGATVSGSLVFESIPGPYRLVFEWGDLEDPRIAAWAVEF